MFAPTPMVPGQKQAIIMQEMRSTQGGLGPLRQVSQPAAQNTGGNQAYDQEFYQGTQKHI